MEANQAKKPGETSLFSDLAITTALMVKRVFSLPLRGLQGFINSIFKLAQLPLCDLIIHALASELKRSTSRSRQKPNEKPSI